MGLFDSTVRPEKGGKVTEEDLIALRERVMEPPKPPPPAETGGILYAFTADEIMSLRRQLLPNRMARHDTPGEARLRQHVNSIKKLRGEKAMD